MTKKLFILLVIITLTASGQETTKSSGNVELPDFIITGKEVISVEQAKKIAPDFVSTISGDFIKPSFSPEALELKEFPSPLKNDLTLFDSLNYHNGWLEAGIGSYFLPTGKLVYSSPLSGGMLEARAGVLNQRAYVENSEKYSLNGGATLYYFINSETPAFNGMKLKLNGDLAAAGYKVYGRFYEQDPVEKRNLNTGNFSLLLNNLSHENFIYELQFSDQLANLDSPNFSENLFGFAGFAKAAFSAFNVNVNLNYKRQYILNKLQDNSEFYFLRIRPTVGLTLSGIFRADFGLSYARDGGHTFSAPFVSAALHLERNVTLFGEFAPSAEFLTENYFIRMNPYLDVNSFTNLFFEKSNVLKAVLKYEYGRFFEIDGGVKFYTSDEIPYFKNNIIDGTFGLASVGGNSVAGFLNLLFHPGPFGVLYGTLQYESAKDDADMFIPYYPEWTASLNYNYDFQMGLSTGASLYYTSETFANLANTQKLKSYVDLGLNFAYKLTPVFSITLKMNNLLNHKNYNWYRYKDLPLNVTGGIKFTW